MMAFFEKFKTLMGVWNWEFARTLGELTILTRASYFMLLFVPFLAALWPTARGAISSYNEYFVLRRIEVEQAIALNPNISVEMLLSAETGLQKVDPNLPLVWALAFLASLFAVLANLAYQVRAPKLVKQMSKEKYVNEINKDFLESPTEDQIDWAFNWTLRLKAAREGKSLSYEGTHLALSNVFVAWKKASKPFHEQMKDDRAKFENVQLVHRGASAAYEYAAQENPWSILLASFLYILSVLLILTIIWTQSVSVLRAAGLIPY